MVQAYSSTGDSEKRNEKRNGRREARGEAGKEEKEEARQGSNLILLFVVLGFSFLRPIYSQYISDLVKWLAFD